MSANGSVDSRASTMSASSQANNSVSISVNQDADPDAKTPRRSSKVMMVPDESRSQDAAGAGTGVDNPTFDSEEPSARVSAAAAAGGVSITVPDDSALNCSMTSATSEDSRSRKNSASGAERKSPKSKDAVAEAVNLELVNMNPFSASEKAAMQDAAHPTNGNGIPIKKDVTDEVDIRDPYDEYFVPVNEHRKYIRGEKLYVTMDKRDVPNGRRCLCWGVGLFLLAVAVLIGILAGTGFLSPDNAQLLDVKGRAMSSEEKANEEPRVGGSSQPGGKLYASGPSSASPPPPSTPLPDPPTTDASRLYVPRVVDGQLTILNMDFHPDLNDRNSAKFKELASSLETELRSVLFSKEVMKYGPADITVKIMDFSSGSVVAKFRVAWEFKEGVRSPPAPIDATGVRERLQTHIKNNGGYIFTYQMPLDSIKTSGLIDKCQINNGDCSHTCEFDRQNMINVCTCPLGLELNRDGLTCTTVPNPEPSAEPSPPDSSANIPSPEPSADIPPSPEPSADTPSPEPSPDIPSPEPSADIPSPEPSADIPPSPEPSPDVPSPEPSPDIPPSPEPSADVPSPEPSADIPPSPEPSADIPPSPEPSADVPSPEPSADVPSPEPSADIPPSPEPSADIPPSPEPSADIPPSPEPSADVPSPEPSADIPPSPEPSADIPSPESSPEIPSPEPSPEIPSPEPSSEIPSPEPSADIPSPEPSPDIPVPEETKTSTKEPVLSSSPNSELAKLVVTTSPTASSSETYNMPALSESKSPDSVDTVSLVGNPTFISSAIEHPQGMVDNVDVSTTVQPGDENISSTPSTVRENDNALNSVSDENKKDKAPRLDDDEMHTHNPIERNKPEIEVEDVTSSRPQGTQSTASDMETHTTTPQTSEASVLSEDKNPDSTSHGGIAVPDSSSVDASSPSAPLTMVTPKEELTLSENQAESNDALEADRQEQPNSPQNKPAATEGDVENSLPVTSDEAKAPNNILSEIRNPESISPTSASELEKSKAEAQLPESENEATGGPIPDVIPISKDVVLGKKKEKKPIYPDSDAEQYISSEKLYDKKQKFEKEYTKKVNKFNLDSDTVVTNNDKAGKSIIPETSTKSLQSADLPVEGRADEAEAEMIKKTIPEVSSTPKTSEETPVKKEEPSTHAPDPKSELRPKENENQDPTVQQIPVIVISDGVAEGETNPITTSPETTTETQSSSSTSGPASSEMSTDTPAEASAALIASTTVQTVFSKCAAGQFQCTNGTSREGAYCVPLSSKCDSVNDCSDGSDEAKCIEDRCPGNFQCSNGQCLKRHLVCNNIVDCSDGSDEINCENWQCQFDEFQCPSKSKRCIPVLWQCDGKPDCEGHSDELNCQDSCGNEAFLCPEGWCIPMALRCDGMPDCSNGEDEQLCDCSLDQFKCNTGGCVPKENVCDGVEQCPDFSDEWDCIRISNKTSLLEIRNSDNEWLRVCGENWDSKWSDMACQSLGFSDALSTEYRQMDSESFLRMQEGASRSVINTAQGHRLPTALQKANNSCSTGAVEISCQEFTCGTHSPSAESAAGRLAGGDGAASGEQPWVAILYSNHAKSSCTASIISPRWLLASYNCLHTKDKLLSSKDWTAYAGGSMYDKNKEDTQSRTVRTIVPYPQVKYNQLLYSHDIALVELETPLELTHKVGAICLPEKEIQSQQICVTAGWGFTNPGEANFSQFYLLVPLMDLNVCNSTKHYSGFISEDNICAGFTDTDKSPCYNDEGSPLMCSNDNSVWELQGVLSYHSNCGRGHHPSVFSSIVKVRSWIEHTIGSYFERKTSFNVRR